MSSRAKQPWNCISSGGESVVPAQWHLWAEYEMLRLSVHIRADGANWCLSKVASSQMSLNSSGEKCLGREMPRQLMQTAVTDQPAPQLQTVCSRYRQSCCV